MTIALSLRSNINALTANRHLNQTSRQLSQSFERLSSGYRINSAKDDPAGLALSETLRAQLNGLNQGYRNATDGLSMLSIADAGAEEIADVLQSMRELAVQSANGVYTSTERNNLNVEFAELLAEINSVATNSEYNNITLLNGSAGSLVMQVGFKASHNFTVNLSASFMASSISLSAATISTQTAASAAITSIDSAITTVSSNRSTIGAYMSRLEAAISYDQSAAEHVSTAESFIRETDFAIETARSARLQLLQQSGIAVLSQANSRMSDVLALIDFD